MLLVRLTPTRTACGVTVSIFRALDWLQLDDELPAFSMKIAHWLFAPFDAPVHACVIDEAMRRQEPNDLLVFALASYASKRLSRLEAGQLFRRLVMPLRSGHCDRMYLVASLLPLIQPSSGKPFDLIEAYASIGRTPNTAETHSARCEAYRRALDKFVAQSSVAAHPH